MAEVLVDNDPFTVSPQYYKDLITLFISQHVNTNKNDLFPVKNGIMSVEIDVNDVISFDPAFAFLLIHYPAVLLPLFEEVVMKQLIRDKSLLVPNCRVRLYNLPIVPEVSKLSISSVVNTSSSLIQLVGTVVRTGGVRMLELSKKFQCTKRSCQKEFCVAADPEQDFMLPHPTRCPALLPGSDGRSQRCNSADFRELPNGKQCVDYQEIKVYDKVEHISLGSIPRSITVLLMDTLVDSVYPGDDVVIVGTPLRQWKPPYRNFRCGIDVVLRANHISRSAKSFSSAGIEKGTKSVVNEENYVPYASFWAESSTDKNPQYLVSALKKRDHIVSSICPDLYGMYAAKLSLLLTVIGGNDVSDAHTEGRRTSIHLLLVGDPGSGKSQLLRFSGELVERSVLTTGIGTTGAGLTCSAQRDAQASSSEWYLEAGALVLASGGVCCIDEFGTMKDHDRVAIHEAMEQQTISVAKAGLIMKLDCKCSIIAASNLKGKFDVSADLSTNTGIAPPLLSRFDLVQVLIDRPDREWDKHVSTFLLKRATCRTSSGSKQSAFFTTTWLKQYIAHIKANFQPKLSQIAFDLLNAYYRQQRQQSKNSSSVRLMESLIRVSQAHARLMYRHDVLEVDAVIAIHLISKSISSLSLLDDTFHLGQEDFPDDAYQYYLTIQQRVFRMLGVNDRPSSSASVSVSNARHASDSIDSSNNDYERAKVNLTDSTDDVSTAPLLKRKRPNEDVIAQSSSDSNVHSNSSSKLTRDSTIVEANANHQGIFANPLKLQPAERVLPNVIRTTHYSASLKKDQQKMWSSSTNPSFFAMVEAAESDENEDEEEAT